MNPNYDEFVAFVSERGPALRRTAYLLTGDWHSAEDVVQSALVKLYVAWPRVRRRGEEHSYARKIVLRAFLDLHRRPWRRERSVAEVPDFADHDGIDRSADDRLTLMAALGSLPRGMRAVIVCRFWEDLSVEQTADVLQVATGTVKSQTAKALTRLRRLIAEPEPMPSGEIR